MKKSMSLVLAQKLAMFVLFCGLIIFSSCDKKSDTDPTPASGSVALPASVVGKTYTGDVTYVSPSNPIPSVAQGTGKVTITATGTNTYTVSFSVPSGVPSIVGLQFSGNGSYASISSGGSVSGITVTDTRLDIAVTTSNGTTWAASATR